MEDIPQTPEAPSARQIKGHALIKGSAATEERPTKRKKQYYDAMDIVLEKALKDKKRAGLKIGQLERSAKKQEDQIQLLKEKVESLQKDIDQGEKILFGVCLNHPC